MLEADKCDNFIIVTCNAIIGSYNNCHNHGLHCPPTHLPPPATPFGCERPGWFVFPSPESPVHSVWRWCCRLSTIPDFWFCFTLTHRRLCFTSSLLAAYPLTSFLFFSVTNLTIWPPPFCPIANSLGTTNLDQIKGSEEAFEEELED